jgi:hypothetical protein
VKHTLNRVGMALVIGILVFSGCTNPFDSKPEEARGNFGRVEVQVGSAARTLQPVELKFDKYEIAFSGPTGASHDTETLTGTSTAVDLVPGAWTITVTAFSGEGDAAKKAAQGSAAVTVTAGASVTAAITLLPYTGEGAAKGTLSYTVDYPAGLESGTLVITQDGTAVENGTINILDSTKKEGTLSLAAGQYKMQIRLKDKGELTAGRTEALHIYPGLTTAATYTFTNADFVAFAEVGDVTVAGTATWDSGEAATSAEVTITVYNDSFADAILVDEDLSGWITNLPNGLSAMPQTAVDAGGTAITALITGQATEASDAELVITIPADALGSGNALTVRSNPDAKFAIGWPAASVAAAKNGDLTGQQGRPLSQTITFTLTNERFTAIPANTNLSEWFTGLPEGVGAAVSAVSTDNKTLTVTLSGTPAATGTGNITTAAAIPVGYLSRGEALELKPVTVAYTITENSITGVYIVGATGAANASAVGKYWKYNKAKGEVTVDNTLGNGAYRGYYDDVALLGDDVHLGGRYYEGGSTYPKAVYTKNGTERVLTLAPAETNRVFTSPPVMAVAPDGEVYMASLTAGPSAPGSYWKVTDGDDNPVAIELENITRSYVYGIAVDNDFIYIAGWSRDDSRGSTLRCPIVWKYNRSTGLHETTLEVGDYIATTAAGVVFLIGGIAVDDAYIHLAGYQKGNEGTPVEHMKYIKLDKSSGTKVAEYMDPSESESQANAITLSGGQVYIAGHWKKPDGEGTNQKFGTYAGYWKGSDSNFTWYNISNQSEIGLETSTIVDEGLAVAVDGTDVYVAGYTQTITSEHKVEVDSYQPVYWKHSGSGPATVVPLAEKKGYGRAVGIAVR